MGERQESFFPALLPDLSPEERKVWEVLQQHSGRDSAVTKETICLATGLDERVFREAKKTLVEVYEYQIGSAPTRPPGYFLITSAKELDDVCNRYHDQALSLLRTEAALRRIALHKLLGQMHLRLARSESDGDGQPG